MSKTQEKRARRKAEQQAFIKERRVSEIAMLENNYELGLKLIEANKEKIDEDQLKFFENEALKQRKFIDDLKAEWGLDASGS